jgi:hypothetical protein
MRTGWCKKVVCGCTHKWQIRDVDSDLDKNGCVGADMCRKCNMYP